MVILINTVQEPKFHLAWPLKPMSGKKIITEVVIHVF